MTAQRDSLEPKKVDMLIFLIHCKEFEVGPVAADYVSLQVDTISQNVHVMYPVHVITINTLIVAHV